MKKTKLTRRALFRKAAIGAASAIAAPYVLTSNALGAEGVDPASDRIALGIIGTGGRAGNFYRLSPILAVCDVDKGHRLAAKSRIESMGGGSGIKDYGDFRDVLARDDIDTVIIATPDHWHCQVAAMASMAGKDIYCEKPLTTYIKEGRRLSDLISRNGTIFQTGSQQRSDDKFLHACNLVINGYIGQVKKITVGIKPGANGPVPGQPDPIPEGFDYNMWLGQAPWVPYYQKRCFYNFRFNFDYAAGKISDWGAHHLDIAQWGIGMDRSGPCEVSGVGEFPTDGLFNCATHFTFECKYPAAPLYPDGLTLYCSDKYRLGIEFEGTEGKVFVTRGLIETTPSNLRTLQIKPDDIHLYDSTNHWGNLITCIKERRETVAPPEVAHRTATICHIANVSMLLGRPVKWDPKAENFGDDEQANRMPMLNRARREPWTF